MNKQNITVAQWHELAEKKIDEGTILSASFFVNGRSMEPFIRYQRDEVTVQSVTRPLKRGDIVLFKAKRLGGDYVLHQVWKIKNGIITTLGSNCRYPDMPIPEEKVLGTAVKIRRGKRVILLDGRLWQATSNFWMLLFPLRKCIMTICHIFKRCLRWMIRRLMIR